MLSSSISYDAIIFNETWLRSSVSDGELGFDEYNIFRCYRSEETGVCQRGGDVSITVKNCYDCRFIDTALSSVEQVFVEICFDSKSLVTGTVYISPASDVNIYETHCEAAYNVINCFPDSDVVIIGDYNLPHTRWYNDEEEILQFQQAGYRPAHRASAIILTCSRYAH